MVDVMSDFDDTVIHAVGEALNHIDGEGEMVATEVFIPGQLTLDDGREVCLSVRLNVFSQELLDSNPMTGGLLPIRGD